MISEELKRLNKIYDNIEDVIKGKLKSQPKLILKKNDITHDNDENIKPENYENITPGNDENITPENDKEFGDYNVLKSLKSLGEKDLFLVSKINKK